MADSADGRYSFTASMHARRRVLIGVAGTVTGVATLAGIYPFLASLWPSERAKVAGGAVQVDVSKLEPGQQIAVEWRGGPVWVLRRTEEMLRRMAAADHRERLSDPDSTVTSQQPVYAQNDTRSLHPEHLVVIGICTHLGCVPGFRPDIAPADLGATWDGGYYCPCHGSRFDFAGRVHKNVPAPTNLVIPPHRYLSDTQIDIGIASTDA